jgi:leucyl aminopeptidase
MFSIAAVPFLHVSSASAAEIETDIVAVPVFEGEERGAELRGIDSATGGALERALASGELQGRLYELLVTPVTGGWRARRLAFVGAGKRSEYTTERLRRVATAVALHGRQRRAQRLAWLNRGDLPLAAAVQAAAEGLALSLFSGDTYKSGERAAAPLTELVIIAGAKADEAVLRDAAERGRILGESCNIARELSNEPSNVLTPTVFADRAAEISRAAGLDVEVLDEQAIERLGMGLLLGIARGSAEPPRVIVMRHSGASAAAGGPVLGLVGKGVTFDTGGISIKPAEGMERMKDDMAGGAAVVCAMRAISLLKAPINVIGIVPTTENMPGGRAVKPGDVLTSASGKTVEVINTDAEGRLILGDALWYARKLGATHLVDVATLTGAAVVALGKAASALFGRPQSWVDAVGRASQTAGDRCWPMPLYDEYADQIRSEIADMMNTGGRPAGACTAAIFLREFAGDVPWAHLDVAGTAWADEAKPWMPKGASGVAVRTLAELAFTAATWK